MWPAPSSVRGKMVAVKPLIALLDADSETFGTVAGWHWHEWSHGEVDPVESEWRDRLRSRSLNDRIPFTVVALLDHEAVGCVSVCRDDRDARFDDRGPWLSGMFVVGRARNLGIGRAILSGAQERSRSFGAKELWLYTSEAGPFYERCGYQYAHRKASVADNSVLWRNL